MSIRQGSAALLDAIRGTWPCGHARTAENTQGIGKAGLRCKLCRRQTALRSKLRRRDRIRLQQLPNKIELAELRVAALKREFERLQAEGRKVTARQAVTMPELLSEAFEREVASAKISAAIDRTIVRTIR